MLISQVGLCTQVFKNVDYWLIGSLDIYYYINRQRFWVIGEFNPAGFRDPGNGIFQGLIFDMNADVPVK